MRLFRSTNSMQARLRNWALRRQGRDCLPLRLDARRVYILPTPAGWTFAVLVAVVFIAGMNYGNGLALLFAFWLAAFALVAMVQTQRTLAGTSVNAVNGAPVFAGQSTTWNVELQAKTALGDLRLEIEPDVASTCATPLEASGQLQLQQFAPRRGRMRLPVVRLSSTAPFGLFRTWTWLHLDAATLVYPRPAGERRIPEAPGHDTGSTQTEHGQDELAWLRDFREGDSPRQIAWKAYARGAPLLVREYRGAAARRREFDFSSLQGLDTEQRLSQLCRWIVDASEQGDSWVLRLPGSEPLEGNGSDHRELCLAHLALHDIRDHAP